MRMDSTDRQLLDLLQRDFPIGVMPYAEMAGVLKLGEDEVITRIKRMMEEGVIRRIGAVIDANRMQYVSCLLAMKVPAQRMEEVASAISQCQGVTHNYERDDEYNLWFTLTARGEDALKRQVSAWEEELQLPVYCFPGDKTYKRKVVFDMQKTPAKETGDE